MPTVATYNQSGAKVGEIQLNDAVFGVEVNEAVMHQAVVRQLSNERLGTHATKTRASTTLKESTSFVRILKA